MVTPKVTYASYMLRLWQVQSDTHATWVASVQSPATGEQRWFANVDALIQFLQHEFGPGGTPNGQAQPGRPDDGAPVP
jgi:hypothetical protein